jgi:secondary thiamine-phosphate synthase enzyme
VPRITIATEAREQLVDVTTPVADVVARSGAGDGAVVVSSSHTTAAVTVNENADPDVARDILEGLARIVPREGWRHAEGNADAHLKAALIGSSVTVPIRDGHLDLRTWQGIFLCEFDGPRQRALTVTVLRGS